MAILTMRSCKRYAVRKSLHVTGPSGVSARGLLIEVSQEGCRISNVDENTCATGDEVILELDEWSLRGVVRWASAGLVGVRFEQALFVNQLNDLVTQVRCQAGEIRYGT